MQNVGPAGSFIMLAELALTGLVAFFPQQLNCDVWTGRLSFSFTSVMVSVAEVIS